MGQATSRGGILVIEVQAITPAIGAELLGVDFSGSVSPSQYDEIYQALIDHIVIFIRGSQITPQNHLAFAELFGVLDSPHPIYPHVEGHKNIVLLENNLQTPPDTNSWHTDLTYKPAQAFASILVARQVPEVGGDTLWSSNYAAYDRLSEGMQRDLEGLAAVHDLGDFRNTFGQDSEDQSAVEHLNHGVQKMGSYIRPLVAEHPITGRKFLNFNEAFVTHILGLSSNESNSLKVFLANHMNKPEDQVRWRWQKDDIAMWDNRVSMHYAVADYLPQSRTMNRITVLQDRKERAN